MLFMMLLFCFLFILLSIIYRFTSHFSIVYTREATITFDCCILLSTLLALSYEPTCPNFLNLIPELKMALILQVHLLLVEIALLIE